MNEHARRGASAQLIMVLVLAGTAHASQAQAQCAAAFGPDALLADSEHGRSDSPRGVVIPGLVLPQHAERMVEGFVPTSPTDRLRCRFDVFETPDGVSIRPHDLRGPCVEQVWLRQVQGWASDIVYIDVDQPAADEIGCGVIALRPRARGASIVVQSSAEQRGARVRARVTGVTQPGLDLIAFGSALPLRQLSLTEGVSDDARPEQVPTGQRFFARAGSTWYVAAPRRPDTTYVNRGFVRAMVGGGYQPGADVGLFALDVELGARPFLGAFGAFASLSLQTAGERLIAVGGGIGAQLDLVYSVLAFLNEATPSDDPQVSFAVGGRVSLMWGRSSRQVSVPVDELEVYEVFELLRPEWRFFADFEWRPRLTGFALFVRISALDVTIDLGEMSRWSALVGFSYVWGRSP